MSSRSRSVKEIENKPTKADKIKKLSNGKGRFLFPELNNKEILNVPLTKSHFLDAYCKGKWNLSKVPCPSCFENIDLFYPPDHYNEQSRLKTVRKYIDLEQWKDRAVFQKVLSKAKKLFKTNGASISLIDNKRQIVKYQSNLNVTECPRRISIDSHTILSEGYFHLQDASKDWRTCRNPFIIGVPNIRFYCGVQLINKFGVVIGALAVFDPSNKIEFSSDLVLKLQQLANDIIEKLSKPLTDKTFQITNSTPLINIIGRPTSQFSLTNTVYEKDGSGSQYCQNLNYKYSKQNNSSHHQQHESQDSTQSFGPPNGKGINDNIEYEVFTSLSSIRDIKQASIKLSNIIVSSYKFDYLCILEIRVSQRYQIASEYFPNENRINAEDFQFANKLMKVEKEQIMTRSLGSFGKFEVNFNQINPGLIYGALSSEFGVYYKNVSTDNDNKIELKSGFAMPFYRTTSKIVRKRKIIKTDAKKSSSKSKKIEVYLRSGGFLVAGFNRKPRAISENELNEMFEAACTLRRMFISN